MKTGLVPWLVAALAAAGGCGRSEPPAPRPKTGADAEASRRTRMVETQIVSRGVRDPRVLAALREVPRHLFVEPSQLARAYDDTPLPIAGHQTISQPYIVALMTELLDLTPNEKALASTARAKGPAPILSEATLPPRSTAPRLRSAVNRPSSAISAPDR